MAAPLLLKTGVQIPETGVYSVWHGQHRLPREVTLMRGEVFPRCAACAAPVLFEPLRALPELEAENYPFRVVLNAIPVLQDAETRGSDLERAA